MRWKILLPIILIAIIAAIIAVFFHLQRAMEDASQYESDIFAPTFEKQIEEKEDENKLPEPTGNIDDTVNAITDSLFNEESLIEDEKEAEAIEADSQALNDFSESYDESEF